LEVSIEEIEGGPAFPPVEDTDVAEAAPDTSIAIPTPPMASKFAFDAVARSAALSAFVPSETVF
jgi:hypothetical protein